MSFRGQGCIAILAVLLSAVSVHAVAHAEPPFETAIPVRGAAPVAASNSPSTKSETEQPVVIVIGGDVGLSGSDQPVSAKGAYKHGTRHDWAALTHDLKPLLNGDINFANLETVVTASNDLLPTMKTFRFRSHPDGVRHLVDIGFNAFSLANNHAADYGQEGLRSTLSEVGALKKHGLRLAAGIGIGNDAYRPQSTVVRGATITLSAVGFGGPLPGDGIVGMPGFRVDQSYLKVLHGLATRPSDYRILSAHYGVELQVAPAREAIRKFRDSAVVAKGIDLVVGHHAHVPAGVQRIGDQLIFYGMGNLLHPGMQDMSRFNRCRDFGLMARLHLTRGAKGHLVARAVEVIPLTEMHLAAKPYPAKEAARRIEVLNYHARGLDDKGAEANGVRFQIRDDGTGIYCTPAAMGAKGRLGQMCRNWRRPTLDAATIDRIASACGTDPRVARAPSPKPARSASKARSRPDPTARKRSMAALAKSMEPDTN